MSDTKERGFRGFVRVLSLLLVIGVFGSYSFWALQLPVSALSPDVAAYKLRLQTTTPDLAWPTSGQSAVTLDSLDDVQTHGAQKAVPTASTAKVITALCVLNAKPLALNETGPSIPITAKDVSIYNQYVADDGSVLPISAGESLTEYQMLQAVLLPSANNIADTLAIWAFGSLSAYQTYADNYVHNLGMADTTIGPDASGFSPATKSTAHDLVVVGKQAMRNPVLAQIVGQATANDIPGVGSINNVNSLLGVDDIVGIKTGNTEQAGGVFLAAARTTTNGTTTTVISAIMAAPTLYQAMKDSLPLIESARNNFKPVTVIKQGATVGGYELPWSKKVIPATAASDITVTAWKGSTVPVNVSLRPIAATTNSGQAVGKITLGKTSLSTSQDIPIMLASSPTKAPLWYRLFYPNDKLFGLKA